MFDFIEKERANIMSAVVNSLDALKTVSDGKIELVFDAGKTNEGNNQALRIRIDITDELPY